MKVRAFENVDSVTALLMLENNNDGVSVNIVDSDGDVMDTLLFISDRGVIESCSGYADDYGFQTDDDGYVVIEKV